MRGPRRLRGPVLAALLLLVTPPAAAAAPEPALRPAAALVPAPRQVAWAEGSFSLSADAAVWADPALADAAQSARLLLSPATGYAFAQAADSRRAAIRVREEAGLPAEGYRLAVDASGVTIEAATPAGAFYALQTLRQLLPPSIYSSEPAPGPWTLPAVAIEDAPRFPWRGLHLDVGRHFMPVEFVKKYIDLLALHKFNTFHWHLTEDQGWRIEIKRYPKLTEVGSVRARTLVGHPFDRREGGPDYDDTPHGGYYTQEEIREVVAFARERHVTVVPEIEFPGHAQAAIAAYPELGNSGEPVRVKEEWGIGRHTLKPSDATLDFYRNVLEEVLALFPSRYIHIGGDEVDKRQWRESEFAQRRIRALGLADERALQAWMIGQMARFLTSRDRRLVGWDEIVQGGFEGDAVVMSWRGVERGLAAARAGHDVVMAPTRWTYFDYYQADPDGEPLALGFYLPLRDVYRFDPAPDSLPAEVRARILGAQGQLWTEFMTTPAHVEYMAYPRAAALAEVVWSPQARRDYADFSARLPGHLARLDELDVNYRPPGNDGQRLRNRWRAFLWRTGMQVYHWWHDLRG